MIQEKRLRLGVLLLQGLSIDELNELTNLLIEARLEWYNKKVKNILSAGYIKRKCSKCSKDLLERW